MKFGILFLFIFSSFQGNAISLFPEKISRSKFNSLLRNSSFEQTWTRYPSPDMIIRNLQVHFPNVSNGNSNCARLTDSNRPALGDNNVLSGKPTTENPNSAFVLWYQDCLKKFVDAEIYQLRSEGYLNSNWLRDYFPSSFFPSSLISDYPADSYPIQSHKEHQYFGNATWNDVEKSTRYDALDKLINDLLGPDEVILENQIFGDKDLLVRVLLDEISYTETLDDDAFMQVTGFYKNFQMLTVSEAMLIAKLQILSLDYLKY